MDGYDAWRIPHMAISSSLVGQLICQVATYGRELRRTVKAKFAERHY